MNELKSPAFQFYAQDFLTGVMYLTNEEIGIYIKMLAKQWTDGKIPKKRLGFLVGIDWDDFSEELKSKFEDMGSYVINTRLEQERDKKQRFIEKQRLNGKKGGRPPKSEKPKQNPNESQKKPLEVEVEIEDKEKGGMGEKTKYSVSDFIQDWNSLRKKHLNKPSFLNKLSGYDDQNNFNDLTDSYTRDDFKNAMIGLFKQRKLPNGNTTMQSNPSHFLKFFNSYLTAYHDKNKELYGKQEKQEV